MGPICRGELFEIFFEKISAWGILIPGGDLTVSGFASWGRERGTCTRDAGVGSRAEEERGPSGGGCGPGPGTGGSGPARLDSYGGRTR
jgi:hypothetical protein